MATHEVGDRVLSIGHTDYLEVRDFGRMRVQRQIRSLEESNDKVIQLDRSIRLQGGLGIEPTEFGLSLSVNVVVDIHDFFPYRAFAVKRFA